MSQFHTFIVKLCEIGTSFTYTTLCECVCSIRDHWRKSRGGGGWGGCILPPPPPTFLGGGGMACTNIPPLFEDKITLNLTFIVEKLTFLTVKLSKTPKIARSLRSLAHKCILRLDLCGFASRPTCIILLTSFMSRKV